jgi:antitoxin (DNA-binding transcriptional repressor) of toxin-antitoxin stability system
VIATVEGGEPVVLTVHGRPVAEIVAATALAHDLSVWTQDEDFDVLAQLAPALRVRRG